MNGEIRRYTAYKVSIGLIGKGNMQLEQDKDDPTKERFRFLTLKDKEINRINLIANVIDKFESEEKAYITLTIDDGTGQMRVKAFSDQINLIKESQAGDTILILGTLRYFAKELYILPEIVKQLDTRWLLVRKLELEKEYGDLYKNLEQRSQITEQTVQLQARQEPQETQFTQQKQPTQQPKQGEKPINQEPVIEKQSIQEEKIQDISKNIRDQIIDIIKEAESEEGIDVDKIIMQLSNHTVEEINNSITSLLEEGTIYEPKPGRLRIL